MLFIVLIFDLTKINCNICPGSNCKENFALRSCQCDAYCQLYNDCCAVHPVLKPTIPTNDLSLYDSIECETVDFTVGSLSSGANSYMVSRCSEPVFRKECEKSGPYFPVTDTQTGITYRNIFCSLCHNISQQQLVPWTPQLNCDLKKTQTLFDNQSTYQELLKRCSLNFFKPPKQAKLRTCYPYVSSCTTKNVLLANNCSRGVYELVATTHSKKIAVFRNKYCAQCNGFNDTECFDASKTPRSLPSKWQNYCL